MAPNRTRLIQPASGILPESQTPAPPCCPIGARLRLPRNTDKNLGERERVQCVHIEKRKMALSVEHLVGSVVTAMQRLHERDPSAHPAVQPYDEAKCRQWLGQRAMQRDHAMYKGGAGKPTVRLH